MTMIVHGIAELRKCIAEKRLKHAEDRISEAEEKQLPETEISKLREKKKSAFVASEKARRSFKRLVSAENRMSAMW
ncbi:MAG: hypothetical protein MJ158_04445, partial [Alphaproteobacteria bacterium]|nr:hypothetical protein [Alphaproteobacteria bacterium]